MECVVLARSAAAGRRLQYELENMGEDWRCIPVTQADMAMSLLRMGAEVLLLQSGRESLALLDALGERPLLAPPWVLGLEQEAPDGRLEELSRLPQWLAARQACLPALAQAHLPRTTEMAASLLQAMAVPRRLRAWAFLPEMCAMTVVHPPLLNDLRHGLYPLTAKRHGMTAAGVERSLRLCVESTWTHGSIDALERFFGSSVDPERGKPTNREFLCRVQERLTLTMRRLV